MSEEQPSPIVIDNGSSIMKVGFGGDDIPRAIFSTVIGIPRYQRAIGSSAKGFYVGDDAQAKRGILSLKYPIEHGVVVNLDDMENIWSHSFSDKLNVVPDNHAIFMTESVSNPKSNREKTTQIMFETFSASSFYMTIPEILSMYATGRTTGVTCEMGDGSINIIPLYEGFPFSFAMSNLQIGGKDLTEYLQKLLTEKGYRFNTSAEKEIVRDIKEKLCYVSMDYNKDLNTSETSIELEKNYELPDGQVVTINDIRFRCTEELFNPIMLELGKGIHQSIFSSIIKCDEDIQNDLFSNIVLSGGTSMFENIDQRLSQEMKNLCFSKTIKIIASPNRQFNAWIGGSILTSLSTFEEMWIQKQEYIEVGESIVHRKCKLFV